MWPAPQDLHNVKNDKDHAEPPGLDEPQLRIACKVPHHSTDNHIRESIGPQWTDQQEDEPNGVQRFAVVVYDTEISGNVANRLPRPRHRDDPAVPFAVFEGLVGVHDRRQTEQHGEEIRGSGRWAEVPRGIRTLESYIIINQRCRRVSSESQSTYLHTQS